MSSYLNCIVEKMNQKTHSWELAFGEKTFAHFYGGARDIIQECGTFMNYEVGPYLEYNYDNITKYTNKKTKDGYDLKVMNGLQFKNFIKYLYDVLNTLEKEPIKFSSIDAYIDDCKSDKDKIKGIINYLKDFHEYKSNDYIEEVESLREAIKEFEFVEYSIEFDGYGENDFSKYRIIFFIN